MKLNNKGFTLVELLATVVIITVLTVIVAPAVLNTMNTSKDKSYKILIENITTASKNLYEEVYSNELLNSDNILYKYDVQGKKSDEITIDDNSITINLQTLVSNGFLNGTDDKGQKIIKNPKTNENIGNCEIKITRKVVEEKNHQVTYTIESEDDNCPTTEEYAKGVKQNGINR